LCGCEAHHIPSSDTTCPRTRRVACTENRVIARLDQVLAAMTLSEKTTAEEADKENQMYGKQKNRTSDSEDVIEPAIDEVSDKPEQEDDGDGDSQIKWGTPSAVISGALIPLKLHNNIKLPGALGRVAHAYSSSYNASFEAAAVTMLFLLASAIGNSIRVLDHWRQPHFLSLAMGLVSNNSVRLGQLVRTMHLPFMELVEQSRRDHKDHFGDVLHEQEMLKAKLTQLARSKQSDRKGTKAVLEQMAKVRAELEDASSQIKPTMAHLLTDLRKVDLVDYMLPHGGCGGVLSLDGPVAAKAIGQSPGRFNQLLRGERIHDSSNRQQAGMLGDSAMDPCFGALLVFPLHSIDLSLGAEQVDGLQQFVFASADVEKNVKAGLPIKPVAESDRKAYEKLLYDCFDFRSVVAKPMELAVDDEVLEAQQAYFSRMSNRAEQDAHRMLEASSPEFATLLATKLAGVIHAAAARTMKAVANPVSIKSWTPAETIASLLLEHTLAMRETAVRGADLRAAQCLLDRASNLGSPFTLSDLYGKSWTSLKKKGQIQAAIQILTDAGWLQSVQRDSEGPGRPSVEYHFHPDAIRTPSKDADPPFVVKLVREAQADKHVEDQGIDTSAILSDASE